MATEAAGDEKIFTEVAGGAELLAWFGRVPSFHDAEVLDVHLDRSGPSALRIHAWNMTNQVDDKGYFVLDRHAVVIFTLQTITALKLEGFSAQNVIGGLKLRRYRDAVAELGKEWISSAEAAPDDYGIILEPCYGLSGFIFATDVRVTLIPGTP